MELGHYNHLTETIPFNTEKRSTLFIGKRQPELSDALIRLALDDIYNGESVVFIDPIGNCVAEILRKIPKDRQKDVLYFNPKTQPFAFNILHNAQNAPLLASTILETLKGIWGYERTPTPNLDQYVRGGIQTLLGTEGSTMLHLKTLLTDNQYRDSVQVQDPILKDFWTDYETLTSKEKRQDTASTLNKLRAFMFEPLVRNCLGQKTNKLVLKDRIVLVSLAEGELGSENSSLLGALILAQLYVEGVEGLSTNLYIDGAHRFGSAILGKVLTSCSAVHTQLSIQFLDQFKTDFQSFILGTVGQIVAFKTSVKDAKELEPEFNLTNDHYKLFEQRQGYATASIDGAPHVLLMYPNQRPETGQGLRIIKRCASQCTQPLETIEKRIGSMFSG